MAKSNDIPHATRISLLLGSVPEEAQRRVVDKVCILMKEPDYPETFSEQFKAIRATIFGLTQVEFSLMTGIPLGTIRDWEQGLHVPSYARLILALLLVAVEREVRRELRR